MAWKSAWWMVYRLWLIRWCCRREFTMRFVTLRRTGVRQNELGELAITALGKPSYSPLDFDECPSIHSAICASWPHYPFRSSRRLSPSCDPCWVENGFRLMLRSLPPFSSVDCRPCSSESFNIVVVCTIDLLFIAFHLVQTFCQAVAAAAVR